jgi:FkbM family methyltransferase
MKAPFRMATPDWEGPNPHPGAVWYRQAWDNNKFNYGGVCGQLCMQNLLSVLPCSENSLVFQAGSHLGIFVAMGAAAGCKALTIEGHPLHTPFIELTADLNGWSNRWRHINAAVGEADKTEGLKFGFGELAAEGTAGVVVPMVSLDGVFQKYYPDTQVPIGIIDVEGYEQKVLHGAAMLLKQQRVVVWIIELWFVKLGKAVTDFSGIQLLLDAGYDLYDFDAKVPKKVDVSILLTVKDTSPICRQANTTREFNCLRDYVAVRRDMQHQVLPAFNATVAGIVV